MFRVLAFAQNVSSTLPMIPRTQLPIFGIEIPICYSCGLNSANHEAHHQHRFFHRIRWLANSTWKLQRIRSNYWVMVHLNYCFFDVYLIYANSSDSSSCSLSSKLFSSHLLGSLNQVHYSKLLNDDLSHSSSTRSQ